MKSLVRTSVLFSFLVLLPAAARATPPGFWRVPGGTWGLCRYMISTFRGDLFVATYPTAGLIRSTTQGASWEPTSLSSRFVTALAADSSGGVFAGMSGKMYRSTDRGSTWQQSSVGLPGASILAACTTPAGVMIVSANARGLYGSTDGGGSWSPWSPGWESATVTSLGLGLDGVVLSCVYGQGILRSTDDGVHWTRASLPGSTGGVTGFAADSVGRVFAATDNGVIRSTDNGMHWDSSGLGGLTITALVRARGGALFAASGGIYRSTDHGLNWQRTDAGLTDSYVYSMVQALDRSLLAGTSSRLFRSTDLGDSWSPVIWGAEGANVTSLVALPSGRMICATQNMGLLAAADTGVNWNLLPSASDIRGTVAVLAMADSGRLFAATDSGAVYRSLNGGESWIGLPAPWKNIRLSFLQSAGPGLLVAGVVNDGVYRSTNHGLEWTDISAGLPNRYVRCMVTVPGAGHFVGTDEGLFNTKDLGTPWASSGLSGKIVRSLAQHPGGKIFAGTAGEGIYCSTDSGASWASLCGALPAMDIWTILSDGRSTVYAGTLGLGVYRWVSNTQDWQDINGSEKVGDVSSMAINRKGLLFAGTRNGVYQSLAPVLTSVAEEGSRARTVVPGAFRLAQNYPNPFNPSTDIQFWLPAASHVRLAVYDLLGREAAVLFDGRVEGGTHTVKFDASSLASGVYLYTLEVADRRLSRTMLLIR